MPADEKLKWADIPLMGLDTKSAAELTQQGAVSLKNCVFAEDGALVARAGYGPYYSIAPDYDLDGYAGTPITTPTTVIVENIRGLVNGHENDLVALANGRVWRSQPTIENDLAPWRQIERTEVPCSSSRALFGGYWESAFCDICRYDASCYAVSATRDTTGTVVIYSADNHVISRRAFPSLAGEGVKLVAINNFIIAVYVESTNLRAHRFDVTSQTWDGAPTTLRSSVSAVFDVSQPNGPTSFFVGVKDSSATITMLSVSGALAVLATNSTTATAGLVWCIGVEFGNGVVCLTWAQNGSAPVGQFCRAFSTAMAPSFATLTVDGANQGSSCGVTVFFSGSATVALIAWSQDVGAAGRLEIDAWTRLRSVNLTTGALVGTYSVLRHGVVLAHKPTVQSPTGFQGNGDCAFVGLTRRTEDSLDDAHYTHCVGDAARVGSINVHVGVDNNDHWLVPVAVYSRLSASTNASGPICRAVWDPAGDRMLWVGVSFTRVDLGDDEEGMVSGEGGERDYLVSLYSMDRSLDATAHACVFTDACVINGSISRVAMACDSPNAQNITGLVGPVPFHVPHLELDAGGGA